MFNTKINVIGVSKYDFTNDNGERVAGCKVNSLYNNVSDNKLGAGITTINLDISKFDMFSKVTKFPIECVISFDIYDFNKKPVIKDIRFI